MMVAEYVITHGICKDDLQDVMDITKSSGFFSDEEVLLADEVARDAVDRGEHMSGYSFIFCSVNGQKAGYATYGKIPCTDERYRIYWLAVDEALRGKGLGSVLLKEAEEMIKKAGGKRIYLETSMREQYVPTRNFYRKSGYIAEAKLNKYFSDDDGMVIYVKIL